MSSRASGVGLKNRVFSCNPHTSIVLCRLECEALKLVRTRSLVKRRFLVKLELRLPAEKMNPSVELSPEATFRGVVVIPRVPDTLTTKPT